MTKDEDRYFYADSNAEDKVETLFHEPHTFVLLEDVVWPVYPWIFLIGIDPQVSAEEIYNEWLKDADGDEERYKLRISGYVSPAHSMDPQGLVFVVDDFSYTDRDFVYSQRVREQAYDWVGPRRTIYIWSTLLQKEI